MAYTTLNKAHTHHKTRTADGKPTTRYSRYETGLITGRNRDLPAVLADCTGFDGLGFDATVGSNDDTWYMLNAFDSKGSYVDTIAVGGAIDGDHAALVAQTQLDHLGASSVALIGLGLTQFDSINQSQAGTFSIDAINKLMDNPSQDKGYIPIITASELAFENDRVTFDSVQWADNSDELLSHNGRASSLLLDMTRADTRNDLVNEFELADTLQLLGAEPEQSFDSLMAIKSRLEPLKSRLFQAMVRAGDTPPKMPFNKGDKAPAHDPKLLYVTNVTETKPFKRQGVTNIAFVFDLSDGQKLSIWFHNPDSTPSKLMPSDIMISWKWMLNKRDVTAALSPKQGDNVQLPVLASRIMRVAAKNSQRFKRTQARQLKLEQDLLDAQTLIDTKNTAIDQLDKDIEILTSRIDEVMRAPKAETDKYDDEEGEYQGRNSNKEAVYKLSDGTRYTSKGGNRAYEHLGGERKDRFFVIGEKEVLKENRHAYMFSDDVTDLSDDELGRLYESVQLESQKADNWNKNMNALQNEGGEGFDFGGEEAEKLSIRRFEIKQEIDRRKSSEIFTPKFILDVMRAYWGKLLFVNEKYDMRDVAESLDVDYFTLTKRIKAAKDDQSFKDGMGEEAAKQIEYYKDNAAGKPAYPEIIAAIIASMGGYKASDNKKLLDIANKIISGEIQAIDVVPEIKKKYFEVNELLEDLLVTSVTDFAKAHAGFNGFINNNNDAETALAGKAKGDWVVAINDSKYPITVFMSLDDKSSYAGATNSDIKSAYNDILERTKDAAVSPDGYDVGTASNNEIVNDAEESVYRLDDSTELSYITVNTISDGQYNTVINNVMDSSEITGNLAENKDFVVSYLENLDMTLSALTLTKGSNILGVSNPDNADNADNNDTTNPNNKKITKGKNNKAKTPKGTKIESRFALVDAKFLIASHTASGTKNPKYPQDLQPRDRARESSIAWVQKTSKALDPESLGRTGRVDTGAPIVGDDLVVESGNGRTIAIKMAYANGDAGEYKEWLAENADMFGMTEAQVNSYKHPVLVRIRTTEVNRAEFAVEANQDDKLSFTASERAKSDAKRVNAGMLELFDPNESGDILAASNRDFVKSFLASLGTTEAAQYTDSNGNPTQALVVRIKSALFSKAYDDDRLLEMMADQTKPDLQNMLNALTMAAPNFVAAQAVNRSATQDLADKVVDSVEQSLSDEVKAAIVDATNMIMNAKLSNQDIKEYVLQQGLFEQADDAVADLAVFLASNARSAKKMADYFNAMASYIEQDSVSRQNLDMFGEPEPLSLADIITHANQVVSSNDKGMQTPDMFNEPVVEPVEPVTETVALTDDPDATDLAAKIDAIAEEVDSDNFDPEVFDVDALMTIVDEVAGNADLTAKLDDISKAYQAKLIAISMQALSDMAGQ